MALTFGFTRSIRAMKARINSAAESFFALQKTRELPRRL